jgi:CRISPR/Cas system-associated endonuclease Cas1
MGKLSLVCDFQELYRYLIDDFLIQYCQRISKKGFTVKTENANRKRKGEREYLNDSETKELLKELNKFFEVKVEVKRIRNGEHQTLETLINEEAFLFAKYLRNGRKVWVPRIPSLNILTLGG